MNLELKFCNHVAADYAVSRWHYSGCLPYGKKFKIGIWESGKFVGVIVFGRGACMNIGTPFGLKQDKVVELVRIAMKPHKCRVSRCISIALKMLQSKNPGLQLVVSYADESQGHLGKVYQAANWIYLGWTRSTYMRVRGVDYHIQSLAGKYGPKVGGINWLRKHIDPDAQPIIMPPKHKYVYALDKRLSEKLKGQSKPYPKCVASVENGTPGPPAGKGRCNSDRHAPLVNA